MEVRRGAEKCLKVEGESFKKKQEKEKKQPE